MQSVMETQYGRGLQGFVDIALLLEEAGWCLCQANPKGHRLSLQIPKTQG